MKKILPFLFFIIVFSINLSGQVLETKNWCLSRCDLVGDERENTELVYLQLKNDSIINLIQLDSIKRIPLRIVNNTIFDDIGWVHLAFCKMDFSDFKSLLSQEVHYQKMLPAFEKLNDIKEMMKQGDHINLNQNLIWEANSDILWHEQAAVVQPLFDQLSSFFSRAMTFCASFDYKINQNTTNWKTHSRFILFMLFNGFDMVKKTWLIPEVTNLQHRWFWIENDLLEKWKIAEADYINTNNKIKALDAAGK